ARRPRADPTDDRRARQARPGRRCRCRDQTRVDRESRTVINGLIGKKLGMTQVTDATGKVSAVTVVQLGPCTVTQLKTEGTDGYDAVQVTFGKRKLTRVNAPSRGHFAKSEVAPGIKTAEFAKRGDAELKLGQPIALGDVFKTGDTVDVSGTSKGHG